MPKGRFTAGAAVLFEAAPSLKAVERALERFEVLERSPGKALDWMAGQGSLFVALRPELHQTAVVSRFEHPWPDGMGDSRKDPGLFGAWGLGHFGPFTFPGCLERARGQDWSWGQAAEVTARHRALVRIVTTHAVAGMPGDAPVIPEGYDPLRELHDVTRLAQALLTLPGALAYFNPGGELLLSAEALASSLEHFARHQLAPLPAWCNVRLLKLDELPGWLVMDTVGLEQVEVQDVEACFPRGARDPTLVAEFLRNLSEYLRQRGPVITAGQTVDEDDGTVWRARAAEESLAPRPRATLRLFLEGGPEAPERLRRGLAGAPARRSGRR